MPLVDYSDSEHGSGPEEQEQAAIPRPGKRRKIAADETSSSLPPLPPAFHDLYASTVRTATRDDPSLHQGRIRQIPHITGNWPTHLYIEWHPDAPTYSRLDFLISRLQAKLLPDDNVKLTSFLTNDLGVPLPLHISLSRPVTLTASTKDTFLSRLEESIAASDTGPFELEVCRAEWHRTSESGRSFLVLRVRSRTQTSTGTTNTNPELAVLLRRCNALVAEYGQPQLYQWAVGSSDGTDAGSDEKGDRGGGGQGNNTNDGNGYGADTDISTNAGDSRGGDENLQITPPDARLGRAFHVSIAWSFAEPTASLKQLTEEVFGEATASTGLQVSVFSVGGIKAKIGNVVTHIALPKRGQKVGQGGRNMLGF